MPQADNTWSIKLKNFGNGFSPLAFSDSLTEVGNGGHASVMQNVDVLDNKLTQGPALADLTSGTQAGNVSELINFILDKATANDVGWALGATKLFKLSSTAVVSGAAVSGCLDGESLVTLKGNLYGFYNTGSAGAIFKMPLSTEVVQAAWQTGLENAIHPSSAKEDIMIFGNGQYVGSYIQESAEFDAQKLDFGSGTEVADVAYDSGYWWIAVNSNVTGSNRSEAQMYLWDGSAIPTTLADEAAVGKQRIGFIYVIDAVKYVAYQDQSSSGFKIGYIAGKSIKPLAQFTGTLPTFAQKSLYRNTIILLSSAVVYSAGAFVPDLPFQLSQHADGGYATVGAIAAPFGTPLISSTDGAGHYRLAKFSGFATDSIWKSIIFSMSAGKFKGIIDNITVLTKTLGAGAACSLTIEADQGSRVSNTSSIATTGKRRHYFHAFNTEQMEDFRIALDWSVGSAVNDCAIREININGHFAEVAEA